MKILTIATTLLALSMTPTVSWADAGRFSCAHSMAALADPITLDLTSTTGSENTFYESPATIPSSRHAGIKSVSSIADLAGGYVMTYDALSNSYYDGGSGVEISQSTSSGYIVITNFWDTGASVLAAVDLDEMTVTITSQVLGINSVYGEFGLAASTSASTPDYDADIEGTISSDGTITLTTAWGIFVTDDGDYADYPFGTYAAGTLFEPSNATMTEKTYDSSTSAYTTTTYNVIVEQTYDNVLAVKNFANYGQTIEIELLGDKTAMINSQLAISGNYNYDWYTYSATYNDDMTDLSAYSKTIVCDTATDNYTVSWGEWTLVAGNYFWGVYTEGSITTTSEIAYPTEEATEWDGDGTETSPYLIKNLGNLLYLSTQVNNYGESYSNAYFKVENDIDISTYRFTPIATDTNTPFSGTFDGNGHTINGVNVDTKTDGYAGLFGYCDSLSTIKNVTVSNPSVISNGTYVGAIAAYSDGTISNCHVTSGSMTNDGYAGLGGIVGVGNVVEYSTVTGVTINGQSAGGYVGGIAGQINASITDCAAIDCTVYASGTDEEHPSGGIVGSLNKATASGCYFTGVFDGRSVYGYYYFGGIAGVCYQGAISQCFVSAHIYGIDSYTATGGIVGALYGSVSDCYVTGSVSNGESEATGGIVGVASSWTDDSNTSCQSSVMRCYSGAVVEAYTTKYDTSGMREIIGSAESGTTVESVYYDNQMTDFGSENYGVTTNVLTASTGLDGFGSSIWTFTDGYYPRLTATADTEAAKFSVSTILFDSSNSVERVSTSATLSLLGSTTAYYVNNGVESSTGYYSSISGTTLAIGEDFGNDTIYFGNSVAGTRFIVIKVAPSVFDGSGTEDDPYLIKTKDDLISLSSITTDKGQTFSNTYFKMTADIDLENDNNFVGISADSSDDSNMFAGTFDGGGYSIHNMLITGVVWTTEPTDDEFGTPNNSSSAFYCGFIGRLASDGVVKNLSIASDCDLTQLWASSGAVVGYNYGSVENCRNYATVVGYNDGIGGIVGVNGSSGTVTDCLNTGSVTTGYWFSGGISGSNYGVIERCQNIGDISASKLSTYPSSHTARYVGGITGNMIGGRITNCVNSGTISSGGIAGGLVGQMTSATSSSYTYHNDLINSINYGTVLSDTDSSAGTISGAATGTGEQSNNYYDYQISLYGACSNSSLEGSAAASTATLISGTAIDGFSTDIWDFTAGSYPVMTQFATDELVSIARSIIINFSDGESAGNFSTAATLETTNDCTWTLKQGDSFTITDNTLVPPTSVTATVSDTVVATAGKVVKLVVVQAAPVFPLDGDGTEDSPYLITSTTDWNNFVAYVADYADDMTDKYFLITNDIDFTDTTMSILSGDRVTLFNGDLDGGGYTLKGFSNASTANNYGGVVYGTGTSAYIHDITVEGTVTATHTYVGGFIGKAYGKFSNVTSRVTVTTTKSYAGGFAGYIYAGCELDSCVNEGTVTSSTTYVAGLAGYSATGVKYIACGNTADITATGASTASYVAGLISYCLPDTLIGCYNTGAITASGSMGRNAAGLIGYAYATSGSSAYYLKDCYNTGAITVAANAAGLIVGVNSSGYSIIEMEDCYNTGDVKSILTTMAYPSTYVAGIVALYSPGSTFTRCWNSGNISSAKANYAVGIAGYYKGTGSATKTATFSGCYNTGAIDASGNYGAGIVGYTANYTTIDSCWNTGEITGTTGLGGIVYCLNGTGSQITNCWNSGNITATTTLAGGIVAYNTTESTVECCFNTGNITATTDYAGGISAQTASNYTNVYNAGAVSGATYVGGLTGSASGSINCGYSSGKITCSDSYYGNIVGSNSGSMSGTYYLTTNNAEDGTDTVSVGLSYAELAALDLGDGWTAGDNYTYPRITTLADNDYAKAYAAAVIPTGDDTYSSITQNFYVGTPDGVTWTASPAYVTIDGNVVTFNESYEGTLIMTATCGDVSVDTELICYVSEVGISDIAQDGRTVISERFYTPAGAQVAEPTDGQKAIYIIVRTYDDGTTDVVKEAR